MPDAGIQTVPEPPVPLEERRRYTAYYLHLLHKRLAWAADYTRENSGQPAALREHSLSWLRILRQCHLYPELRLSATTLISTLHPWPLHWGYWIEWEQELRFAVEVAAELQQPGRQAEFLADLTSILFNTGRLEEVLTVGEQAIQYARLGHEILPLAEAGGLVVYALFSRGQAEEASQRLEVLEREVAQEEMFGSEPEKQLVAQARLATQRLRLLRRQLRWEDARALVDRIIQQLESLPRVNPNVLADAYVDRSNLRWARDEYAPAVQDMNQAIELVVQSGHQFAENSIRGNLGLTYWSMGELNLAEDTLRRSIVLSEELHTYWRLTYDVGNLALVYLSRGHFQEALALGERHLALARDSSSVAEAQRALDNCGLIKLHLGDYASALQWLEEALPFYEQTNMKSAVIVSLANLSRSYQEAGQADRALGLAEKAFDLAQEQDSPSLKIVALRCLAEQRPPEPQRVLLRQSLRLARECQRRLDEAACLLSLAAVAENAAEQVDLWQQGVFLLNTIGAGAWLQGCSPDCPPRIVIVA